MQNKSKDSLQKARDYTFLLLKFRPRSEKEIIWRLKKKKFEDKVTKETVSFLKDKGFLDDNYFAQAWIESRLKKPFGLRRIEQELKQKGIDKEIIQIQIEGVKKDYCEEDIVLKLAKGKWGKLKGLEPKKARQRIFAYLLRRGFSPEIIIEAINRLD